jgi:ribonuclease R
MSTQDKEKRMTDPMAEREAAKYEFPVPSREAVLKLLGGRDEKLDFETIAGALGVTGERDLDAFGRRLRAMERDGQLFKDRRGRYGLPARMDMVRGRVSGHPDGFGFLIPEDGGDDLFLSPREMRAVMHGDRVLATVTGVDQRGRKEGSVVEVLERVRKTVVGKYVRTGTQGFVVPHDRRINQQVLIPGGDEMKAAEDTIVLAEITAPPTRRTGPVGRVIEVLGEHLAPGMEIEIAIRAHDIPYVWPEDVQQEASAIEPTVAESAKAGRYDLRPIPLVTIDGEDARDFDDAVFCEPDGKGWRLIVAIADVSHYVRPGSPLDREAQSRGNSVYFPRHVIPMLPEALSNGLCSINPHVDRLCLACEMSIDAHGEIRKHRFHDAVMRSHARLTYTQVATWLAGQDLPRGEQAKLLAPLNHLYALFKVLHKARLQRGAVDFDLPETKILFDEQRKIRKIVPLERNDAHRLIEECMLAANVCAAEYLKKHKVPIPYRIHEGPTPEKLLDLREFLKELGLALGGGDAPDAKHYSRLIAAVAERPDARLIHTVLLRSLQQAMYSPDNIGHFALGYPNYTHFTSPIRRYPDLMVHRAIRSLLRGQTPDLTLDKARELGLQCSLTERRADEATREVIRWLKVEFMQERVGEEYDGIISGVTNFGLFVELKEVYVDGLVHITALGNDYFHFDPARHRLLGERTRRTYRLGDAVRIRVVRVDLDEAKIDFELVLAAGEAARTPARERGRPGRGPKAGARHEKHGGTEGVKGPRRRKRRRSR